MGLKKYSSWEGRVIPNSFIILNKYAWVGGFDFMNIKTEVKREFRINSGRGEHSDEISNRVDWTRNPPKRV